MLRGCARCRRLGLRCDLATPCNNCFPKYQDQCAPSVADDPATSPPAPPSPDAAPEASFPPSLPQTRTVRQPARPAVGPQPAVKRVRARISPDTPFSSGLDQPQHEPFSSSLDQHQHEPFSSGLDQPQQEPFSSGLDQAQQVRQAASRAPRKQAQLGPSIGPTTNPSPSPTVSSKRRRPSSRLSMKKSKRRAQKKTTEATTTQSSFIVVMSDEDDNDEDGDDDRVEESGRGRIYTRQNADGSLLSGSPTFTEQLHGQLRRLLVVYGRQWTHISTLLAAHCSVRVLPEIVELYYFGLHAQAERVVRADEQQLRLRSGGSFYAMSTTAARLFCRVFSFWNMLHDCLQHYRPLISYLPEAVDASASGRALLPDWWIPVGFDELLLMNVGKWGFDASSPEWRSYLNRSECPFWYESRGEVRRTRRAFVDSFVSIRNVEALDYLTGLVQSVLQQPDPRQRTEPEPTGTGEPEPAVHRTRMQARSKEQTRLAVESEFRGATSAPPKRDRSSTSSAGGVAGVDNVTAGVELPLVLSKAGLTILSLGVVNHYEPAFHTTQHIYPVGFKSSRELPVQQRQVVFWSEIVDPGVSVPVFQVTCADFPDGPWRGTNPTDVWRKVYRWMAIGGEPRGTDLFGLSHKAVQKLIQGLPNASKCVGYVWKFFGAFRPPDPELTRHPIQRQAKRQRRLGDGAGVTKIVKTPSVCMSSDDEVEFLERLYTPPPIPPLSLFNVSKRLLANIRYVFALYPPAAQAKPLTDNLAIEAD